MICQFVDHRFGKRRTVYLGRIGKRNADAIKSRIEQVLAANRAGHGFSDDLQSWLDKLDNELYRKLAKLELVPLRVTVGAIREEIGLFIESKTSVKESTRDTYRRTEKHLVCFFGEYKKINEVGVSEAIEFKKYLQSRELKRETIRRTCGIARQFFSDFVKRKLISENPFVHDDIPTQTGAGDGSRQFYVNRELMNRVLSILPDLQWQLMFLLARVGGLRCPSEVLALKWSDIDFESCMMSVNSPKTEHLEGKGSRQIPLYKELEMYLRTAYEERSNSEFVITRFRDPRSSYSTRLKSILKKKRDSSLAKTFSESSIFSPNGTDE